LIIGTDIETLGSSAATALAAANAFVSLGLKAAGYQYINIDDTWSAQSRVNGQLSPDSTKWPNGIASVASTIHGMGLKMGLSSSSSHITFTAQSIQRLKTTSRIK